MHLYQEVGKTLHYGFSVRILILIILSSCPVFAQLSPGDLHLSHSQLEGLENCTQCHKTGEQLSSENCLNCHTLIKDEISQKKGLHANPKFKQCETCHVEHQGKNADLIFWEKGQNNFDHAQTGVPLQGKHKELKCRDCHKPEFIAHKKELLQKKKNLKHTFLGLDTSCVRCHMDEHRAQFKENCTHCHNQTAWKPAPGFDHNNTRFKLTGKHKQVKCQKCHKVVTDHASLKNPDFLKFLRIKHNTCVSCHEDVHRGQLGKKCSSCHNTSGWNQYSKNSFNHDRTRYPLKGMHKSVACEKCHTNTASKRIAHFKECNDCHENFHRNEFSVKLSQKDCADCHTTDGFERTNFSLLQHSKTRFSLQGAHQAIPCLVCHKQIEADGKIKKIRFHYDSFECFDCHRDVHNGAADDFLKAQNLYVNSERCTFCHSNQSWQAISFDHSKTKFPLLGKHLQVRCQDCHKVHKDISGKVLIPLKINDTSCSNCHQDIHQGQFADQQNKTSCAKCHSPTGWAKLVFDHNRDSRFQLDGAHRSVECVRCHPAQKNKQGIFIRYKPLSTDCASCHGNSKTNKVIQ